MVKVELTTTGFARMAPLAEPLGSRRAMGAGAVGRVEEGRVEGGGKNLCEVYKNGYASLFIGILAIHADKNVGQKS